MTNDSPRRQGPTSPSTTGDAEKPLFSDQLLSAVAELLLRTTYDGVWLINAQSQTTFVNERTARMLGYEVAEMIGRSIFDFMDNEARQLAKSNLVRRKQGLAEQHEFRCLRKDGSSIWFLVTANPVYDRDGNYAGSLAMIADLSLMKAREEALLAERAKMQLELRELARLQATVDAATHRDPLTGLHSRAYFEERLVEEGARAQRHQRPFGLVVLDVDHFTLLNERWGRVVGDEVLRAAGRALAPAGHSDGARPLRISDVACRYGGNAFAVLAPETGLDGCLQLAARLRRRLQYPTTLGQGIDITPSFSGGVAAWPTHGRAPGQLLAAVDRALYAAKRGGGGRVGPP